MEKPRISDSIMVSAGPSIGPANGYESQLSFKRTTPFKPAQSKPAISRGSPARKRGDPSPARGEAYNVAGNGTITVRAFAEAIFAAAGAPYKKLVATPLLLRLMGIIDPIMRELIEMQYLMDTPVFLDDRKLRAALPPRERTCYYDAIAQTVSALRGKDALVHAA